MSDILIYGDIGRDNTAKSVADQLAKSDGVATVHINSGGGDVYEGIAILNLLRAYEGEMTIVIESLAASAASFIAVGAGARVVIRPNAELMIHKAWTAYEGNSDDLSKIRSDLDRQDVKLAGIYAGKAGGDAEQWISAMAAETWYSAQEALDAGLVDAIEDARREEPVEAGVRSKMYAKFKYQGREAAPPPKVAAHDVKDMPDSGQKGDAMSILNQLAQELGKKPEDVTKALSGFFNEVVPISGEVEVTYPNDLKIVPTETIKVEPIIGDKKPEEEAPADGDAPAEAPADASAEVEVVNEEPAGDSAAVQLAKSAGLSFEMGTVAEGYEASVDEGGVVTIKAPSGAEVGSTAEFSVKVNDADVALTVTVRSLSEEQAEEEAPTEAAPAPEAPSDMVTLDAATYKELKAAAQAGWAAMETKKAADLEAEVDGWIKEGRISAALRTKAVSAIKRDAAAARDIFGSNPKNTIPRAEVGYGKDAPVEVSSIPSREDLINLANARRAKKK